MNEAEKLILLLNNPASSYSYCYCNKNANLKLHEDIVVNNAFYAFQFARYIPGANIEKLQKAVINSNNPYYIYLFAYYVKKSNKEALFRALLKLNNQIWIDDFIKDIPLSEELKELAIFI